MHVIHRRVLPHRVLRHLAHLLPVPLPVHHLLVAEVHQDEVAHREDEAHQVDDRAVEVV